MDAWPNGYTYHSFPSISVLGLHRVIQMIRLATNYKVSFYVSHLESLLPSLYFERDCRLLSLLAQSFVILYVCWYSNFYMYSYLFECSNINSQILKLDIVSHSHCLDLWDCRVPPELRLLVVLAEDLDEAPIRHRVALAHSPCHFYFPFWVPRRHMWYTHTCIYSHIQINKTSYFV